MISPKNNKNLTKITFLYEPAIKFNHNYLNLPKSDLIETSKIKIKKKIEDTSNHNNLKLESTSINVTPKNKPVVKNRARASQQYASPQILCKSRGQCHFSEEDKPMHTLTIDSTTPNKKIKIRKRSPSSKSPSKYTYNTSIHKNSRHSYSAVDSNNNNTIKRKNNSNFLNPSDLTCEKVLNNTPLVYKNSNVVQTKNLPDKCHKKFYSPNLSFNKIKVNSFYSKNFPNKNNKITSSCNSNISNIQTSPSLDSYKNNSNFLYSCNNNLNNTAPLPIQYSNIRSSATSENLANLTGLNSSNLTYSSSFADNHDNYQTNKTTQTRKTLANSQSNYSFRFSNLKTKSNKLNYLNGVNNPWSQSQYHYSQIQSQHQNYHQTHNFQISKTAKRIKLKALSFRKSRRRLSSSLEDTTETSKSVFQPPVFDLNSSSLEGNLKNNPRRSRSNRKELRSKF